MRFQEGEREWRLPGFLYTDDLVLCGESKEDLREMVGVNGVKSKVMVLGGEEGLECEVCVNRYV